MNKSVEYAKLAKRANTRLKALEDSGVINNAYRTALNFTNEKNRFSQSKKLSGKELDIAYRAVENFLNDKESKLKNNKTRNIEYEKVDNKIVIDTNLVNNLSENNLNNELRRLTKIANSRIERLEKEQARTNREIHSLEKVKGMLNGKTRFYTGTKYTKKQAIETLHKLEKFLNYRTSTITGLHNLDDEKIQYFEEITGVKIKSRKDFWDFLSSEQFKNMSKYADSNQIVEDFVQAMDEGFSLDEIAKTYNEFENTNITFDQVAEIRKKGGKMFR